MDLSNHTKELLAMFRSKIVLTKLFDPFRVHGDSKTYIFGEDLDCQWVRLITIGNQIDFGKLTSLISF